jgi:hypothetical protein
VFVELPGIFLSVPIIGYCQEQIEIIYTKCRSAWPSVQLYDSPHGRYRGRIYYSFYRYCHTPLLYHHFQKNGTRWGEYDRNDWHIMGLFYKKEIAKWILKQRLVIFHVYCIKYYYLKEAMAAFFQFE